MHELNSKLTSCDELWRRARTRARNASIRSLAEAPRLGASWSDLAQAASCEASRTASTCSCKSSLSRRRLRVTAVMPR